MPPTNTAGKTLGTESHPSYFLTTDCPFCGASEAEPCIEPICDGDSHGVPEPYRSMAFRIWRCAGCGCLYQREQLKNEHLHAFYDVEDYHCYKSFKERGFIIRNLALMSARKLIASIERHRPPEAEVVVDFGCGNGSWLELFEMCEVPWKLFGTEISEAHVEHIERLGFTAYPCDDSNLTDYFEPASVGAIWMHHVIEHVSNPLRMLERMREVLVPGGVIAGQTPDARCLERSVFKEHWSQWHLPHHLVVFDRETLRAHAEKAGLEVLELKGSPSGATQWACSILKSWSSWRGRTYRWTSEPLHPLLTLSFAPLAVLQAAVHTTSHMDFLLRRPK